MKKEIKKKNKTKKRKNPHRTYFVSNILNIYD